MQRNVARLLLGTKHVAAPVPVLHPETRELGQISDFGLRRESLEAMIQKRVSSLRLASDHASVLPT